jgi:pimeloyl-ACP methyl ester carboxylesterase
MNLPRLFVAVLASFLSMPAAAGEPRFVRMTDGVPIAIECAGQGPTLLIVHGGMGDHTRWTPLFPLLAQHIRVCAMDRRGHGRSGDSPTYSLEREALDVEEAAKSFGHPISVLGHSYGGVVALEAALRTTAIRQLILYEPPLQEVDHSAARQRISKLIAAGDREKALETFLAEIVQISPVEIQKMKSRPSWAGLVVSVDTVLRQDRALAVYRWRPHRVSQLRIPILLLLGEKTRSPQLRMAIQGLHDALPNERLVVLPGQEHNAMDEGREDLVRYILEFVTPSV